MVPKKFRNIFPTVKGKLCFVSIDMPLPHFLYFGHDEVPAQVLSLTGYLTIRHYWNPLILMKIDPDEVFKMKIKVDGFSSVENFAISTIVRGALLHADLLEVDIKNLKYLSYINKEGEGEKIEIY